MQALPDFYPLQKATHAQPAVEGVWQHAGHALGHLSTVAILANSHISLIVFWQFTSIYGGLKQFSRHTPAPGYAAAQRLCAPVRNQR